MEKLKNVLVVDDDYVSNMQAEAEIKNSGLAENVEIAHHGEEGINKVKELCVSDAKEGCIDLVILDINMPVMDGIEFLRELDKLNLQRKPKVVVLTNSHDPEEIEQVNQFHIAGFVNKPFLASKLHSILQSAF